MKTSRRVADHSAERLFWRGGANPAVSIAIPCLNEAKHIAAVVHGFLGTKYSNLLEILVADGGSTDGTPEIVLGLSAYDARVKLLDNPRRIQSFALNIALAAAKGDVFLRADAHCIYAPDYVDQCVGALLNSEAVNVGGAQRFIASNLVQAGTAIAVRSVLGSGGAKYKDACYNGYAETVFLGCFWRSALEAVNGYDLEARINEDFELNTRLSKMAFSVVNITNQDAELNLRLRKHRDRAIYVASDIQVWYWPRPTWRGLAIQYFKYGRGRAITSMRHGNYLVRGGAPYCGLVLASIAAAIAVLEGKVAWAFVGAGVAASLVGLEAIRVCARTSKSFREDIWRGGGRRPGFLARAVATFLCFAVMNIAHGSGYAFQLLRVLTTMRITRRSVTCFVRW